MWSAGREGRFAIAVRNASIGDAKMSGVGIMKDEKVRFREALIR